MNRIIMLVATLVLSSSHCFATDLAPSSIRELIILGLEKNIGLQIEQIKMPVAETVIDVNDSVFDPVLFASADYARTSTPFASSLSLLTHSDSDQFDAQLGVKKQFRTGLLVELALDTQWLDDNDQSNALNSRYRSGLNLSLTQPLLKNFGEVSTTRGLRLARNQLSQAELNHQLQAQALAMQIELLAARFAGEKEIVDLRTEAVVLAEELHAANKRRFDTGVIPISEVQEAETALANRELNLSLALQAKELSFESLNRLFNHALQDSQGAQQFFSFDAALATVDLPDFEQLLASARDKNLNLQLAVIDTNSAQIEQGFYQNQLKPQLDFKLRGGLNGLSGDEREPATSSSYRGTWGDSFSSAAAADGYQWGAGLQFSLPIGNRSAKARLRQADLQHRQATYQLRDLDAELKSQLQQQVTNVMRAAEQVKIASRFETLAKLSLQQEQRRQAEGLSDTFRVISFQDKMIDAKVGRIDALVQYFAAVAQLNFTRGIILEQHQIVLAQKLQGNASEIM